MTSETKNLIVVWVGVVLLAAAFFGTVTAIATTTGTANNKKYSKCIDNNMQWINGSCVK